jgi:hypothetical protein
MKRVLLIMLCLGALCLSAAPAMASSPTNSAYSGSGATQISQVQTPVTTSTSSLPFTGLNLAVVGLVAVVLAGSGLILRRRSAADRK